MKQTCQVPGFLSKLWMLAGDESTNDLICWGHDGSSFVVLDDLRFSKEVLPLYFKHCNMASFIRQLNMYDFHKVVPIDGLPKDGGSRRVEFQHQYFQRSQAHLLPLIKRKVSSSRVSQDTGPMSQVLVEVSQVGRWCNSSHLQLLGLCRDNERLWREMDYLRQKYHHQHQIIRKIIQFIASTVQSNRFHGVKRQLSIVGNKGQASSAPRFRRSLSVQSTKSNSYLDSKDCVYSILTEVAQLLQPPHSNLSGLSVSLDIPSSFAEDLCGASPATSLYSSHTSSFLSELSSDSPDLPPSHPREESAFSSAMTDAPSSSSSPPPSVPSPSVISEELMSEELPFLASAAPSLCQEVPVMFSAVPCMSPGLTYMSVKLPSVEPEVPRAAPQQLNGSAGQENVLRCPATFPDVLLPGERSQMFCDVPPVPPPVTMTVPSMLPAGVPSMFPGVLDVSTNHPSVARAMSTDIPLMFANVPSGSVGVPTVATSDPLLPLDIPFGGLGVPSVTINVQSVPTTEVPTEVPSVFPDIFSGSYSGPPDVEDALSLLMEPGSHTDNITEKCVDDPLALIDCSLAAINCSLTPSEDHLDLLSELFSPAERVYEHGGSTVQTSERKSGALEGEETPLHALTVPETLPLTTFGLCGGGDDEDVVEGADILPSLLLLAREASALEQSHLSVLP